MKDKILLVILQLFLGLSVFAQTQQGYVKTIGRPGKKGKALSGVTIRVKGEHNDVVSGKDGGFSIIIRGKKNGSPYSLQNVQKNGYELNDFGTIGREYAFSTSVPLTIVMVSTDQLQADKLRIEKNAYEKAEKNYKAKMAILEKKLSDNAITAVQYRDEIQKLRNSFDKYESLIESLADHYAHTDYDELDEKDTEINILIENGELEKADSLIQTLFDPINILIRNKEALASLNQTISDAEGIIQQANEDLAAVLKQQEKDAEYLYQLYTIAISQFEVETAGKYLETRAALDSTNIEWNLDVAQFLGANMGNYRDANKYLNKALNHSIAQYGEENEITIECYNRAYAIQYANSNLSKEKWVQNQKNVLELAIKYYQTDFHSAIAPIYANLGTAYLSTDSLDLALQYTQKTIDIYKSINIEHPNLSSSYTNLGLVYAKMKKYDEALKSLYQAMRLRERQNDKSILNTYQSIAACYYFTDNYDSALVYYFRALEHGKKYLYNKHPIFVAINQGIAKAYFELKEYGKCQEYLNYALETVDVTDSTTDSIRGIELADIYISTAFLLRSQAEFLEAIAYYKKALDIKERFLKEYNKDALQLYTEIGYCYFNLGRYDMCINCMRKQIEIMNIHSIRYDDLLLNAYGNIGLSFTRMNDLEEAKEFVEKSIALCKDNKDNNDNKYCCFMNAGEYYMKIGDISTALNYWLDALEFPDSLHLPSSNKEYLLLCIADAYEKANDYNSSIYYYQQRLNCITLDSVARAETKYWLGRCFYFKEELDKAYDCFLDAISVLSSKHERNEIVADANHYIGSIYFKKNNYNEAKEYYKKAISIGKNNLKTNAEELGDYYNNYGLVLAKLQEHEDALKCFEDAKRIYEISLGNNHIKTAGCHQNISAVYFDQRKYHEAISSLDSALTVYLSLFKDDPHANIEHIEQIHEIIENKISKSDYGYDCEMMLLAIYNAYTKTDDDSFEPYIELINNDLGNLYYEIGRYEESEKKYLSLIESTKDEVNSALMQINLANLYIKIQLSSGGQDPTYYNKAIESLLVAENILSKNDHPNLLDVCDKLADLYLELGDYNKSLEYQNKVFHLRGIL